MDPYENEEAPNGDNKDATSSNQTQEENDSKSHSPPRDVSGRIFVGGLASKTTSDEFFNHFSKYGVVTDYVIMKDPTTGQPRGFGFVTYADPYVVDRVLQDTHIIVGKQLEVKKRFPPMCANDFKNKIFVRGIPATVTEDEFKTFFMQFGEVKDQRIVLHHITRRSRGFGFITFESEKPVHDLLVNGKRLELAGAQLEIKKAEHQPSPSSERYSDSRTSGGGDAGGSGIKYHPYQRKKL